MTVKKRRIKQKTGSRSERAKQSPRNRYMRGAKLSEYRFLKILRGFAYGDAPKIVASETGISEKTVRASYDALRRKVREAAQSGKDTFGFGSRYLFENGALTERGMVFLESVSQSKLLESYLADQAPRLTDETVRDLYVFDLGMRVFAGLVVADEAFTVASPGLRRALDLLDAMKIWIEDRQETPGFFDDHKDTLQRYRHLRRLSDIVVEQGQIIALRRSRRHSSPGRYFYEDLRRYLLKNPIG